MANFSVNQFRHLYVATAKGAVSETAAAGTIDVKNDNAKTHVYFPYMGKGGQMRSDLIKTANILYAKATKAEDMATELKAYTVTLDTDVNEGVPVAGQDYILKIKYNQFVGLSDEDNYFEYGEVHATTGMSASTFYKKLAISLAKNTAKQGLVEIKIVDAEGSEAVTALTKESDLTGNYTSILIDEKEQDWVLGTKEQTPVYFELYGTPITVSGDEALWAKIEETEPAGTINNGKKIADLEYFCMGERGDIYRNVGWPNVIPTQYMIDPTQSYHVFDIHYAFVGDNEAVQKSEKDLTIVCADKAVLNNIITAFNTATGLNVTRLS